MIVIRALRKRARFVVGPALGIALTGYFAYHLVEGDRGLNAWFGLNREIRAATANLEAVRCRPAALAPPRSNFRPGNLGPALLGGRIRSTLNLLISDHKLTLECPARRC